MINIRQHIKVFCLSCLAVSTLAGCNESDTVIYIDELYQRGYITSDIYPQSQGNFAQDDINIFPSISFDNSRNLMYSQGGISSSITGNNIYELYFRTVYAVKEDLTASLVVYHDADTYIADYNSANGFTGEDAYKLMPAGFYTFENNVTVVHEGRKQGDENFIVVINSELSNLEPGRYILPLSCILSNNDIAMSESMGIFDFRINYTYADDPADNEIAPSSEFAYILSVENTDPGVEFDSNCNLQYSPGGIVSTVTGQNSYELAFRTANEVNQPVSGTLALCSDPASFINNYNNSNGYYGDDAYQLLSADYYTISNGSSVIAAGETSGDQPFKVVITEDLSNLATGNYLIPLTITVNDPNIEISRSAGTFVVKVAHTYADKRANPDVETGELNEKLLTPNEDFTYALTAGSIYSSNNATIGRLANLFDSSPSTGLLMYRASVGGVNTNTITLTFTEPVKISRIGFSPWYRVNYSWNTQNYNPQRTHYVGYKTDGSTITSDQFSSSQTEQNGYFHELNWEDEITKLDIVLTANSYNGLTDIYALVSTL